MATTTFFDEIVKDQGGKIHMSVRLGRSSFYCGCQIPGGVGQDSIFLDVNGSTVIMDREAAKRFIEAVIGVGRYHGLVD